MILFTKEDCEKCQWVKDNCNLKDVLIYTLGKSAGALAALAYYECVTLAEKHLPILVTFSPDVTERIMDLDEIAKRLGKKNEVAMIDDCGDRCRWEG